MQVHYVPLQLALSMMSPPPTTSMTTMTLATHYHHHHHHHHSTMVTMALPPPRWWLIPQHLDCHHHLYMMKTVPPSQDLVGHYSPSPSWNQCTMMMMTFVIDLVSPLINTHHQPLTMTTVTTPMPVHCQPPPTTIIVQPVHNNDDVCHPPGKSLPISCHHQLPHQELSLYLCRIDSSCSPPSLPMHPPPQHWTSISPPGLFSMQSFTPLLHRLLPLLMLPLLLIIFSHTLGDDLTSSIHPQSWASLPVHSLYQWLIYILHRQPNHFHIVHTRMHTTTQTPETVANHLADTFAMAVQQQPLWPPSALLPTFFLNSFFSLLLT